MAGPSLNPQTLVVDASIAVWAILPVLQGKNADAARRFVEWGEEGATLVAPAWWAAECTTAIRRAVFAKVISDTRAHDAISDLFALEVQLTPVDAPLCEAALEWSSRLKQAKAYDAFYVALAHRLGCELWTADERLANAAAQAKLKSVHWVGES